VASILLAAMTLFAYILRIKGLETAAYIATVASVPLAIIPFLAPLVRWWQRLRRPLIATSEELDNARRQLSSLLLAQWRTESKLRSLDDPDPIPVRWRLTDREELIDLASNRTAGVLTVASSDDVRALIAQFKLLRRRRLVILGDAGSGKTTLAVQILLELLRSGDAAFDDHVPVLLSLARWDPSDDLYEWIGQRILHDYPELSGSGIAPHVIMALAVNRHVLPVLDGLDEMSVPAQQRVIQALNRSLDSEDQLVLTSRTDAFGQAVEAARHVLGSAVVLEPEPVSPAAAADYLERCLSPRPSPPWSTIIGLLRDETPRSASIAALADVAKSPLGLWLIRMAYISPGVDPSPLIDDQSLAETSSMRKHLFDRLISACIQARPPSDNPANLFRPRKQYEPADVERWLRFLAENLDRWDTRDFDWARDIPSLAPTIQRSEWLGAILRRFVPMAERWVQRMRLTEHRLMLWASLIACGLLTLWLLLASQSALVTGDSIAAGLAGLFTVAVLICAAATTGWCVRVVVENHGTSVGIDWADEIIHLRRTVRRGLTVGLQVVSFGVAFGATSGATIGILARVAFGELAGLISGLVSGGAVGFFGACFFLLNRESPAGSGDWGGRWYGQPPWVGLKESLQAGALFGGFGGGFLTLVYVGDSKNFASAPIFIVSGIVVVTAVLGLIMIALLPLIYSASSAFVLLGRLVLLRRPTATADERPDSLELWRKDAFDQKGRLLRVGFVSALAAVGVDGTLIAIGNTSWWEDVKHHPASWLLSHVSDFAVTWSGQLRYVFALVLAWAVTYRSTGARTWRRWIVFIAVASGAVLLWPSFFEPDSFAIRLAGQVKGSHLTLQMVPHAVLKNLTGATESIATFDLGKILSDTHVWVTLSIAGALLGLVVVFLFTNQIEGGGSNTWWATRVALLPHVAKHRLPWLFMEFLDDAHRLGLLRAVGATYQFRHGELQDYLADTPARMAEQVSAMAIDPDSAMLESDAAGSIPRSRGSDRAVGPSAEFDADVERG
jgi:hypothetical protein